MRAAHLGVNAFLTKPPQRDALIAEVVQALGARRGQAGAETFAEYIIHVFDQVGNGLSRENMFILLDEFLGLDHGIQHPLTKYITFKYDKNWFATTKLLHHNIFGQPCRVILPEVVFNIYIPFNKKNCPST